MKPFTKLIYLFSVLAIAGLIAVLYFFNDPGNNNRSVRADFILTASELHDEFTADEPAANLKYIGKIIEITGKITSVNLEEDRMVSIILKTSDNRSSVICSFREPVNPKSIQTMKPITVRGELSGYLMDVLLNNCVVIN